MSTLTKRIAMLEQMKKDLNELTTMLTDALENDDRFIEAREKQRDVARDTTIIKSQVMNEPANAKLSEKIKGIRKEMSEEKQLLAQELAVYFSKEGRSDMELPDGSKFQFKLSATYSRRGE